MDVRAPFTRHEAETLFARFVAGWARRLDNEGARTMLDGIPSSFDAGGSYEGVTRMFWGIGGWLSQPDRARTLTWQGAGFDVVALMRRAVLNGTNPRSPSYWGVPPAPGQYHLSLVESGHVAFTLWQSRNVLWSTFSPKEQDQVIDWLSRCGQPAATWKDNFALFWLLNHASRKALGRDHDDVVIAGVLDYLDRVYQGAGWYDDAPATGSNHFDDYSFWVFGTHALAWSQLDGWRRPDRQKAILDRVRELMTQFPCFFSANGAYTEYGRSLSYKFARLGPAIWAYQQGCWPYPVGMLKRLVSRHLRWYVDRGAIRGDDTLREELTIEGSPQIRETYIATGSPYWAMQAFGALWSLPDDDPFWLVEEEPLPVESGDFTHVIPGPGWVLVGTQASGEVQRFSAISSEDSAAKYSKFHYATAAPFNVGLVDGRPVPDAMLSLVVATEHGHRHRTLVARTGEPGWLRFSYEQHLQGRDHKIETAILTHGEQHLRIHRVSLAAGATDLSAIEGGPPLGFSSGAIVCTGVSPTGQLSWACDRDRFMSIEGVHGYSIANVPTGWRGTPNINSVYGHYVLPSLSVSSLCDQQILVCLVTIGATERRDRYRIEHPVVTWSETGEIVIGWPGEEQITIPPITPSGVRSGTHVCQ